MPCLATSGRPAGTGCIGANAAGLNELRSWLVNRSEITFDAVSATTGISAGFTMTGAATVFPYAFDQRNYKFNETMTTDQNTGAQTHKPVITGRFIGLSGKNSADVERLKNINAVWIVEEGGGKFIVVGRSAGIGLDTNSAGSDAAELGELVTLSTSESAPEKVKYCELLDTDAATTLAALIAAE